MASAPSTSTLPAPLPPAPTPHASLSQDEQDALHAAVFRRLHPRLYLERYVAEGVRPDGRAFGEGRGVSVNVGSISTADGSALVHMGETTIVCGVKAEIAEPELDRELEGFLVPNLDLPAMCSPKFKPGPPTEEAQVLSDRLNQALVASNFLPLDALCIHPGKAAWVLYVDATCVNYDGNAFDAALLAMVAALRNTTLPQATYDPETQRTVCARSAPRIPLRLAQSAPIAVSLGIFDSKHVLMDPTSFEEPLLDSSLSVVLGDEGAVVAISQLGSLLVSVGEAGGDGEGGQKDALAQCMESARRRRAEVMKEAFST